MYDYTASDVRQVRRGRAVAAPLDLGCRVSLSTAPFQPDLAGDVVKFL